MRPTFGAHIDKSFLSPYQSFLPATSCFCRHWRPSLAENRVSALKRVSDQAARSQQDSLPLLDAVREAGDLETVYPFHIPGHKVRGYVIVV